METTADKLKDRRTPPPFRTIDSIDIPRASHSQLSNGISLFSISAGSQEITRLEFIFRAGMYHQPATLIASCTNSLLESGTKSFTADQLSDGIDFYGSYLEFQVEQDYALVTLYALNRYLRESLKFVEELLKWPIFPETEFRIHVNNKRQKHLINSQKVNVLAKRRFSELMFGPAHPYGRDVADADFDRVNLQEIKSFFSNRYNSGNCAIIAAGALPANLGDVLNEFFGAEKWGTGVAAGKGDTVDASPESGKKVLIRRDDALQSAIRIGRPLFNRTHPDYFGFQVLNTVLGGYFGSRLMTNIREDKGYTYGIGSGVSSFVHGGYFFISTEVGCDVTSDAIREIHREMKRLRDDLVDTAELETVRNYMLGNFLRTVDGPFALAEKFRILWDYDLGYDYFDRYFAAVKHIQPAALRELANKYLVADDMWECVAGKKQG